MLSLCTIDRICEPGGSANEDACGVGDVTAWVIDGATGLSETPLLDGPSDAHVYAHALSEAIAQSATRPGLSPRALISEAILRVRERFDSRVDWQDVPPHGLPSAVLALLRLTGQTLEWAVIGDCKLLIPCEGGVRVLIENTLQERMDREILERVEALRCDGVVCPRERFQEALPLIRARRGWALTHQQEASLDPQAAANASAGCVPIDAPAHVLLVSDGFYRLVDTFGRYTPQGLLEAAVSAGLSPLLGELRALEAADETCAIYPRFKVRDDATALLVHICPGGAE